MADFTFGAGNTRKVLALPLYALGAVVSWFVPRNRHQWVVGSGIGLGEGAVPVYLAARDRLSGAGRVVWLARDDDELAEAAARGFDTVPKDSWAGFWTTLRAGVIVVTHGFGDANRYATRGGFVVQLWHGLPFKHLHLDSPSTYAVSFLPDVSIVRRLIGAAYRRAGRGIGLFTVASDRVRPSIASAFAVPPERIVVTGDPRDDVLLAGPESRRISDARARLDAALPELPTSGPIILFAPTWRDGADDPTVPTAQEWEAIAEWLQAHDATLLVRIHPLGRGDYTAGTAVSPRIVLMCPEVVRDVNAVLWAVDLLVTDYSSMVFDFALVGRPVVFFTPDVADYTGSRGFYVPFEKFTGGRAVTTWDAALEQMTRAVTEGEDGPAHRHAAWIRREFFDVTDGRATERVVDLIMSRATDRPWYRRRAATPSTNPPPTTGAS